MDIFIKEDEIFKEAQKLLQKGVFSTALDEVHYKELLDEYKKLLKQMKSLVKISDLMQGELKELSFKLEKMSNIDSLTSLYNRRFFNEAYQREWLSAVRSQDVLAVLMVDIDHFKKYNDTYGHLQGDKCLKSVADAVQRAVKRPRDLVARYGGEEFVILLSETDTSGACRIAEQVLFNIKELGIRHAASSIDGIVSVSIGVASTIPKLDDLSDELLKLADEALYRAKNNGGNCICLDIIQTNDII